eukprot:7938308-Pyramimonas_sp.AAC.1
MLQWAILSRMRRGRMGRVRRSKLSLLPPPFLFPHMRLPRRLRALLPRIRLLPHVLPPRLLP